jgi:hypothetical protein
MRRAALLLAVGLAALACDGPTAGEVSLVLTTPNQDDGAISFTVQASAPNEITGVSATCDGCQAFTYAISATEVRAIITGNISAGPIARVSVLNGAPNQAYRVTVREVAGRQFDARSGAGYTLSVQP